MPRKTKNLITRYIFFTFTVIIIFFNASTTATAIKDNITIKVNHSLYNISTSNKYEIKAKVTAKDKTSMMSFNSSELRWANMINKSSLTKSAWALEGNSYTWEPREKSQYIKIPLRQKFANNKNPPESVNEIEIEYRDTFLDNPVLPLVKITTLDKKNLTKKVLHFQKQPFSEELLDVSSASWIKKNTLYLARRALGIKPKPTWHYSQDSQQTVIQSQLNKNLRSFDIVQLVLDEKITEKLMKGIICNFRISDSNSGRESIIPHTHLDPVFIKVRGKNIIRYKISDFMQRRNFKTEMKSKSAHLKELIIFIPGSVEDVVRMRPVKSILFLKQNNELNSYRPDKEGSTSALENSTTLDRKNILPKLQDFKKNISIHHLQTQTLSRYSKRLIIKLPGINNMLNDGKTLESIDLFIKPTNPNVKSGFRLQRARKIIRNSKTIKSAFAPNTNNFRRWGGPFTNITPSNKKFEYIKINDFYPFENFNKSTPYESSKESRPGFSMQTNDNSLFRILNTGNDIVIDFWFLSKKSIATLNISTLGSFEKNQSNSFDWKIEGPLQGNIMDSPVTPAKSITDGNFLTKNNSFTTFNISPNQGLTEYNRSEIRGRLVLKNIRPHYQKNLNVLETLESDRLKNKNLVHSRGITIQEKEPFKKWYSVVKGLKLEGKGKWIEINWPTQVYLKEDTQFYFGVSKGAESISSLTITPFNGTHQLKPISAIPNKSVRLNLAKQNIDHLKLRIKLHKNLPFNLVLREMALFQAVAITEDEAVKLSKEWQPTRLIPSQFESTMPTEVSIDNENLKITGLPRPGHSETVRWKNIINKKAHSIGWLKAEYRISKSVHTFNKCWLELTWVGRDQRVSQTICTRSSEGHILIPVNANYNDDFLKSIHWVAHIGLPPELLALPVSFDLKVVSSTNNDVASGNYINFPLLKLRDKKIFPTSLNKLTIKKNISNNSLNLGVHSMGIGTLDVQKIDLLDHPFLHVDFISLEKNISNNKSAHHSIWELPFIDSNTNGEFSVISLTYKLVLFFIIVLIVIFMWFKGRLITKKPWFTENTVPINEYRQQLFTLLVKITPSHNQTTLLNRLFGIALIGLALGMVISNNVYAEYIIFISTILLILGVFYNEFRLKNNNQKKLPLIILGISCTVFLWFGLLLVYSDQSPSRFIAPLLVLVYFYIPWFSKLFRSLLNVQKNPGAFWLTAAGTTYFIAFILLIGGCGFKSFLNILSVGHLAIVPYLGHIIQNNKKNIEYHLPVFPGIVYDSKENIYVTWFFIFALSATLFRIIDLSILAEQFSIIAFYLLATGITLKIKTLFKAKTTPRVISSDL